MQGSIQAKLIRVRRIFSRPDIRIEGVFNSERNARDSAFVLL
ncbi:hypothetical protein Z945_2584 [Sulfitobacter noctilucae]|nr:hypothetical protein Z945_2584 [Sulfitobacter noctilucae]